MQYIKRVWTRESIPSLQCIKICCQLVKERESGNVIQGAGAWSHPILFEQFCVTRFDW